MSSKQKRLLLRSTIALSFIIVIGLFAVSAVKNIQINQEKDIVMMDAINIERAAKAYCKESNCIEGTLLSWNELEDYASDVKIENYQITEEETGDKILVHHLYGLYIVELHAKEEGMYEWPYSQVTPLRSNQIRREHIVKKGE